jgi:urea carboxylase
MWNRHRQTADFRDGRPWLLRFFDRIRFFPVTEQELLEMREAFPLGRYRLRVEEGEFRLGDYQRFLSDNASAIGAFKARQQAAFEAERERWRVSGQADLATDVQVAQAAPDAELDLPPGCRAVATHVAGNVWRVPVKEGDRVHAGDPLVIVESMKMEIGLTAPVAGTVARLFCQEGSQVAAGQDLLVLREE